MWHRMDYFDIDDFIKTNKLSSRLDSFFPKVKFLPNKHIFFHSLPYSWNAFCIRDYCLPNCKLFSNRLSIKLAILCVRGAKCELRRVIRFLQAEGWFVENAILCVRGAKCELRRVIRFLQAEGWFVENAILCKVLTTVDLTSLGVGSCVGTGMYLVAGMVAQRVAGPSVVMSFIVAAVASLFS
ncbi:hypothetical protein AVEN_265054-1, partial [Araneus ventricosus]